MGHRTFMKIRLAAAEAICSVAAVYDKLADQRVKQQRSLDNDSSLKTKREHDCEVIGGINRETLQAPERMSA